MKLNVRLLVASLSIASLFSFVGCSKPSPEEQKKQEALTAALASAMNTPALTHPDPDRAPAAAAITLESKTFDSFNAKLMVPQGTKVLSENAFGVSMSFPLDEMSLNEVLINLNEPMGVNSVASAVDSITSVGDVVDTKKEIDKTSFQIVTAPQHNNVSIYQYKKLKKGWVKAVCMGPTSQKDKLIEICGSLSAK